MNRSAPKTGLRRPATRRAGDLSQQAWGPTSSLAYELASRGIRTRDELADQSLDELESVPGLDPERAGQLIMAARAHLFESAGQA